MKVRTNWDRRYSPPREEGWTRHQENNAKPPPMERTGWSLTSQISVSDHPVCAASVASRHFLTGAATPLKELDVTRVLPQASTPFDLQAIVVFGNAVVVYAFQVSQRRFRHKAGESSRGDKRSEPVCELYS